MTDRPGAPGNSPEPEYDWLWGKDRDATRKIPRDKAPAPSPGASSGSPRGTSEPTRRPSASPTPPTIAPEPGRGSGGPGGPGRGDGAGGPGGRGGKPWTTRRRIKWGVCGVLALVVVWAGLMVWAVLGAWHSVPKVAWEPGGHRPGDQDGTTYLLVGSDSRAGLTAAQRKEYTTGDDSGQRTDTIMLVHTGGGHSMVMSIPRDSQVPIPGHGTTKINAAFAYGGAKLLTQTIEQNTGIHIDAYVETGLGGLPNMVDAVGGVTICPKTDMKDPLAGLNVKKGCQQADGRTALAYARSRHALATGDLGRAADQREVIASVMHRLKSPAIILNPFRLHHVGTSVGGAISVGKGMSLWQAYHLYGALKALSTGKAMSCGTPIENMNVDWDPTRSKQMFRYIIDNNVQDIPKSLCTPTGLPKSVTG